MPPNQAHPEMSSGATAPRACRLRVGIPARWPLAGVPGRGCLPRTAQRLAAHGIQVFEIRPGIIRTDMTAPVEETYAARIAAGQIHASRRSPR
jgi:hypothetical protein